MSKDNNNNKPKDSKKQPKDNILHTTHEGAKSLATSKEVYDELNKQLPAGQNKYDKNKVFSVAEMMQDPKLFKQVQDMTKMLADKHLIGDFKDVKSEQQDKPKDNPNLPTPQNKPSRGIN